MITSKNKTRILQFIIRPRVKGKKNVKESDAAH